MSFSATKPSAKFLSRLLYASRSSSSVNLSYDFFLNKAETPFFILDRPRSTFAIFGRSEAIGLFTKKSSCKMSAANVFLDTTSTNMLHPKNKALRTPAISASSVTRPYDRRWMIDVRASTRIFASQIAFENPESVSRYWLT